VRRAWSKPANNSAGSTATYISGHCEPPSNGMPLPKTSQPTSTITPATPPDDHRAAAENLRSSGHPPGARVLAELGDDRTRFADARALKAYAGSAPVTRASGRSHIVTHRRIKNDRLAAVGYTWAFMAVTNAPEARAHYQRRKTHGERHGAALRHLFNRMLGQLHHCLQTGQTYDPIKAFGKLPNTTDQSAA
jgi:hypothetical protein